MAIQVQYLLHGSCKINISPFDVRKRALNFIEEMTGADIDILQIILYIPQYINGLYYVSIETRNV